MTLTEVIFNLTSSIIYFLFLIFTYDGPKYLAFFALCIISILQYGCILLIMQFIHNIIKTFENLFTEINRNLKLIISTEYTKCHSNIFQSILKCHQDLIASIEIFNKAFGITFLGAFISSFSTGTFETYFAISNVLFANDRLDFLTLIVLIGNLTTIFGILYYFLKVGSTASSVKEIVRFI